jgi:hypothetical protein
LRPKENSVGLETSQAAALSLYLVRCKMFSVRIQFGSGKFLPFADFTKFRSVL